MAISEINVDRQGLEFELFHEINPNKSYANIGFTEYCKDHLEKRLNEIDDERKRLNEKQANLANNDFEYIKKQMIEMFRELRETRYTVENWESGERSKIVNDEKLVDALNLYRAMLSDTKQVFGDEKMTEAVIIQAIEAASYGMWRSIMGGKVDDTKLKK